MVPEQKFKKKKMIEASQTGYKEEDLSKNCQMKLCNSLMWYIL